MFPKYDWQINGLVKDGQCLAEAVRKARGPSPEDFGPGVVTLPDIEIAVSRLKLAATRCERVYIHADYDVDGITSATIMSVALSRLGARVFAYIPDRTLDGYGLTKTSVMRAVDSGATVLVTVDCGASDFETVRIATESGLDVVILDHHAMSAETPAALAVVNPHRNDSEARFKEMSAAGICYVVARALLGDGAKDLVDFAALGTVADVMPLVDANREIVVAGLCEMQRSPKAYVRALARVSRTDAAFTASDLAFRMAPRLNAAGRMGDMRRAFDLLNADDYDSALNLATLLEHENRSRQDLQHLMYEEALCDADDSGFPVAVVSKPGWHRGLIGLVAGQLCETLGRPVAAISVENGYGRGSVRSHNDFDVALALGACSSVLSKYGGHSRAGGFDIKERDISTFKDMLATAHPGYLPGAPTLLADCEATLGQFSLGSVERLDEFEPCGEGNPRPCFLVKGAEMYDVQKVGRDQKHLKFRIRQHGDAAECICFGAGDFLPPRGPVDLVVEPSINEFRSKLSVSLQVLDMRLRFSRGTKDATPNAPRLIRTRYARTDAITTHLERSKQGYTLWPCPVESGKDLIIGAPPAEPHRLKAELASLSGESRVILNFGTVAVRDYVSRLRAYAPDRELLAHCYRALKNKEVTVHEYATLLARFGVVPKDNALVLAETAITIFNELGLAKGAGDKVVALESARKLDLMSSPTFELRQSETHPVIELYCGLGCSAGAFAQWLSG